MTYRSLPALLLCLLAACGEGSIAPADTTCKQPDRCVNPPPATASVTGTVVRAGSDDPLAGVVVTIASTAATTDAAGRFSLVGVPVGAATAVRATLRGFVTYNSTTTINASGTTLRIGLQPQTLFEVGQGSIYIAPGTTRVRAIVLCIFSRFSSRGFASGNPSAGAGEEGADQGMAMSREAVMPLVNPTSGVALMGVTTAVIVPGGDKGLLIRTILEEVATLSGREELLDVPLIVYGVSAGAPPAARIMADLADRVAGAFLAVPSPFGDVTDATLAIPTYLALAARDSLVDNTIAENLFRAVRARGARWAIVSESGRDHYVYTASGRHWAALRGFITEVLRLRQPVVGNPLVPVEESSGWLGDPLSLTVSPWSAFSGARETASWLPSEEMARLWREHGRP